MKYFAAILSVLVFFNSSVSARDLIERTLNISVESTGSEAKQEAFDKATEEATFQIVQEILGPEKALKVWPAAKSKVLKASTRFILFIRSGAPQSRANGLSGSEIPVSLKLSSTGLETVLREEGLLSGSQDGSVRVLPLVTFLDASGFNYNWWMDVGETESQNPLAKDFFKQFQSQMASVFKSKGIYVFDPTQPSFRLSVPGSLRSDVLQREDQSTLAQYYKADVVLSGIVRSYKPRPDSNQLRLDYDLQVWQARTGRIIGEIQRSFDLVQVENTKATLQQSEGANRTVFSDMSNRVAEAVSTGALNLSIVKLAVNGQLNYQQIEDFKKALLDQTRELRGLKPRLWEPNRVTFEADSQLVAGDLAKVMMRFRNPQFQVEVREAGIQGVNLWVRAL